jgi:glycosyltransferase involved in cell wall biosynthesis
MQKDVLIIIPAYNEEKNISKVLDELEKPEISQIADILVMNDASSDNTNWIVKKRKHTVVTHVFNLGYGSALQLGYKYAIRRNYKYVIQMDADGQHDACNILNIYRKLTTPDENNEYPDIVLGSRYLSDSPYYYTSKIKHFAYWLFRHMIHAATGRTIMDPTTGLQGLSRRTALYYSRFGNFDDKYPDANVITNMLLSGCKVIEIPATMHTRTNGKSMHSGLKPIGYMFHMFFSLTAVIIRQKYLKNEPKVENNRYDIPKES